MSASLLEWPTRFVVASFEGIWSLVFVSDHPISESLSISLFICQQQYVYNYIYNGRCKPRVLIGLDGFAVKE